jgi:chaperonin GroES
MAPIVGFAFNPTTARNHLISAGESPLCRKQSEKDRENRNQKSTFHKTPRKLSKFGENYQTHLDKAMTQTILLSDARQSFVYLFVNFAKITRRSLMATPQVNVRPLHDRILVQRLAEEEKTAGGLFIPDNAKEKPQQATVIATGKGRVTEDGKVMPLEVKKGDKVLFSKYSGTELKFDGKEYLMIREEDVLGVIQ